MIIINPGSGPMADATEDHALVNIRHFLTDCGVVGVSHVRLPDDDRSGRFAFLLWKGTRCHHILMPGLPLERVRFVGLPQDPWEFPRLYVDHSSWLWRYALLDASQFTDDAT